VLHRVKERGYKMKTRTLVLGIILILTILVLIGSCATGKKAVEAPLEPFYGTSVSPDYNGTDIPAKKILRPDGKKYYKVEAFIFDKYSLYRLDETDSVLECVWSNVEYPSEIETNHLNYRIYYRQ
jgi:hypothetical protein